MTYRILVLSLLPCLMAGCRTYREEPLRPEDLLRQARQELAAAGDELRSPSGDKGTVRLAFAEAARLMHLHSPALVELRERHSAALTAAGIATPLPDPVLSLGGNLGTDLSAGRGRRLQPAVDFGFAIPLGGRLGRQDDLRQALAEEARVELAVGRREAWLELHRRWQELLLLIREEGIHRQVLESARRSLTLLGRLVEAGTATALDRGLLALEVDKQEAELLAVKGRRLELVSRIAALVGADLPGDFLPRECCPPEPPHPPLPDPARARRLLVANSTALGRLRAGYDVAERRLRLEISKQYPDLQLGTAFAGEPGEEKKVWGLSLGITLPIFDRNRHGIAEAVAQRRRLRELYKGRLKEDLTRLAGILARCRIARERCDLLHSRVVPRSRTNLKLSRRALEAGGIDPLKQLEVERAAREVRLDLLEAERECRHTYMELERLLGLPLATGGGGGEK